MAPSGICRPRSLCADLRDCGPWPQEPPTSALDPKPSSFAPVMPFGADLFDDWPPRLNIGLHQRAKGLRRLSLAGKNLEAPLGPDTITSGLRDVAGRAGK